MAINVVLFDLGGVLIHLPPMATMMTESSLTEAEIRRRWGTSQAVRRFESGHTSPEDFAGAMVEEFALSTPANVFLDRFTHWPTGLLPGAMELLASLADAHHVACLSNTNALHWERFGRETDLLTGFHSTFASHHIGLMKPDPDIYHHVVAELGVDAATIAFFDDNQPNVDAARKVGLNAHLARGPQDVSRHLESLTA